MNTPNTARSRFDRVRGRSQPRSSEFARDARADVATVPPMRSGPAWVADPRVRIDSVAGTRRENLP